MLGSLGGEREIGDTLLAIVMVFGTKYWQRTGLSYVSVVKQELEYVCIV